MSRHVDATTSQEPGSDSAIRTKRLGDSLARGAQGAFVDVDQVHLFEALGQPFEIEIVGIAGAEDAQLRAREGLGRDELGRALAMAGKRLERGERAAVRHALLCELRQRSRGQAGRRREGHAGLVLA